MFAHNPWLTTIARGVASPSPQGQATTNIVTNVIKLCEKLFPNIKYIIKVIIAIKITDGTKNPDTLSAIFCIEVFVPVDSITNFTISDIVDSFPIFSALYSKYPS